MTGSLLLYVENLDARFQQAIDAGCTVMKPLQNQFGRPHGHGDRPIRSYNRSLASHVEEVSEEEMRKRGEAMIKQMTEQSKC